MTLKEIQKLRKRTDKVCHRYPDIERSHVYHTLLLLKKTPLERLKLALTRAQKIPVHR